MYKIGFTSNASKNLNDIGEYIGLDNLFYSKKVTNEILQSISFLETFPFIGREIEPDIFQLINPKYKFKIVYSFDKNTLLILAIFREQENWN